MYVLIKFLVADPHKGSPIIRLCIHRSRWVAYKELYLAKTLLRYLCDYKLLLSPQYLFSLLELIWKLFSYFVLKSVVYVASKLWPHFFPTESASLLSRFFTSEHRFYALYAKAMWARKLAGFNHNHHAYGAVLFDFYFWFLFFFFLLLSIELLIPNIFKFLYVVAFDASKLIVDAFPNLFEFLVGYFKVWLLEQQW